MRRLWWPYHTFWMLTKFVGMRDRLRCPNCHAVGTWKPHGGLFERPKTPRRWLCKWCGYYVQRDWGVTFVKASNEAGCWVTPDVKSGVTTPAKVMARSVIPKVWPWRG